MDYYASHSTRFQALQTRLGATCPVITWQGNPYSCLPKSAMRKADLSPGGFQINADFEFSALVSEFLTDTIQGVGDLYTAMLNTRIGYLNAVYRARIIHIAAGGLQIRVECYAETQNA